MIKMNKSIKRTLLTLALFLLFFHPHIFSRLELGHLFSDHVVLQRNQPINIWGWAESGSTVKIAFNGQKFQGDANEMGKWMITLPAMKAGGPYEMNIQNSGSSIDLKDILIGDVWLCSGQSNMEWMVKNTNQAALAKAAASDTQIRHFKIPKSHDETPSDRLEGGHWEVTSAETVEDFTAVGYYFASEMRKHQDVPIGLINSSWGGSRIEAWMSGDMLKMEDAAKVIADIKAKEVEKFEKKIAQIKLKHPGISTNQQGMVDSIAVWANPGLEDADWETLNVTKLWETQGYDGFDGFAWYRTTFELTAEEAANDIIVSLGKVDDSDWTYINGIEIGHMINSWNTLREYTVSARHLKEGKNSLTVRVEDIRYGGGIYGEASELYLQTIKQKISLAKEWKFKLDALLPTSYLFNTHHAPTLLYNKMIHPLLNYPIKGALWYQGESNANTPEEAMAYEHLFKDLIKGWRNDWAIGEFPYLFVQLANFNPSKPEPGESNWAILRESQSAALSLKNTGQAVIIDIGEADDIHPRNKTEVGKRLALAARQLRGDKSISYTGPVYHSHRIQGHEIYVSFKKDSGVLSTKNADGTVTGFAIAGADKQFKWAKGLIKGNEVVLYNESINAPKFIRYAWADNPENASLINRAGLPACPFRTDRE